jgi:serine/threonine-protein kinase
MPAGTHANYSVTRQLGEGGVGRVYEAVHHPSGRVVAIKTLRSEHGLASQRLLLDEAAAAAQLAHPSVVELLDVGRDDRGGMFLVMELVRGSSLESWSSAFPGLATVLRAASEVLDALSTAHAQGIIHGDLKPANVLLTIDGRVKLTDFGIAHVIDPLKKSERRGVQGTPYYMAPEQLMDLESIAPPSDLYALGVMLYELLAGREPYSSEGTLADMLVRKLHHVQSFAPRRGLAVPPELSGLVMDLLTPDPRMRPRFAARVARMLHAIAARSPNEPIDVDAVAASSVRTWVDTPLAAAPTISSSDNLPVSGASTRSLPFSLPCIAGAAPEVALHRLRPLPLLGRDAQVKRLRALAVDVVHGHGARGMVVSGRAGEGKTRLVRHGFAEVEREGTMVGAAASFDETIANAQVGLRAGITRLLGAPYPTLQETLGGPWRWLASVRQDDVDFARMHEWLSPNGRALDLEGVGEIAAMCVLAASRVHPIYLWLDDVAWSRDGAMELMARLLEKNVARVLVVGTLRSGTAEHPAVRAWLLRLARTGALFEMLPPLSASERVALFEAAGPVAPDVAQKLGVAIDEPTLVLVEAVRAWIDEGLLVASDAGWVLRDGTNVDDLVARARESVLARRIATLLDAFGREAPHAERVLCHAALLGLRFEERVLRACAGTASHVDRVLDRSLLSGLLRVDGRGAYRFEHRMFLDVIVERCAARKDAPEIFRATADALAKTYGRRNLDTGLATAALYRSGGDADAAADCMGQTTRALSRANAFATADRALALFATWNEADALPAIHFRRGLFERVSGVRHYFALDYVRARTHLERAREIFETLGAVDEVHGVLFDLSSTHFYQDHFADCERHIQFVHDERVLPAARARAYHRLSELAGMRCDMERALALQVLAVETAARGDDPAYQAIVVATLAEIQCATGRVDDAVKSAALQRELIDSISDRLLKSDAERVESVILAARGYFEAARAQTMSRLEETLGSNDTWHVTAETALLLLCVAGANDVKAIDAQADAFVEAYKRVAHDEPFTWYCVRASQAYLRGSGRDAIADRIGAVLDARLAHIEAAFTEDEPITHRRDPALASP